MNDTCPITNIWELTKPEWKGKFFIEDPLNDASTLSKLITSLQHAEEMKAAYVALYGSEPVLDADTPDAGWLWLKRFAQNGPIPQPGGDEVDSAFATPGMTDSYMALTSYSNMADVLDGNLAFEPCWGLTQSLVFRARATWASSTRRHTPMPPSFGSIYDKLQKAAIPGRNSELISPIPPTRFLKVRKLLEEIFSMTWFIDEQYAYDHMIEARDFYLLNLGQ